MKGAYEVTVLLGRYPDMAVTPFAEFTKLLHFWMLVLHIILDRQIRGVIDANVSTQAEKYA